MKPTFKSGSHASGSHYDANYGNFQTALSEEIRREAFGEDIGQNSWLTAREQNEFLTLLQLGPGKTLLDVACGAGGPALRIAVITGCSVVGLDSHESAIAAATALAAERNLTGSADFRLADAAQELPFANDKFDAITCIDAINHLCNREHVVAEWKRVLKPGGRLLFTDPIIVTGPLTNEEIAIRSSAGYYLFVPPGYDEDLLARCGLRMVVSQDLTKNMAEIAARRKTAREAREKKLRAIEGNEGYERQQRFLSTAALIAREGRLSRFLFVAEKA